MKRLVLAVLGLTACASAESVATVDAGGGGGGADGSVSRDASVGLDATVTTPDAMVATNTCTTTLTCTNGQMLGTVSGDTGAGTLSASGHQAGWFRVRVTEDYSDSPGLALRLKAKLTQPAAGMFDVFVYVNPSSDTIECNTTTGTITSNGNVKEVRAEWGEGFIPNGGDDSRDVVVEVRPLGTSCSASTTAWQLQLDGNWLQ